jgi:hypothetical protein
MAPAGPTGQSVVVTTTDDLWGSYITGVSVDLVLRQVAINLTLDEGPERRDVCLLLEGVTELHVDRPGEGWERVELTEVYVSDSIPVRVELVFWSEPDGIVATCAALRITVA